MARELKGYAKKRAAGKVPHRYPAPRDRRGVWPPVTEREAGRYVGDTMRRAEMVDPWRGGHPLP